MCRSKKRYEPIDYIMGIGTITKVAMENLLAIVTNRDPARRLTRDRLDNAICNVHWRQSHDAVRFQGGMISNGDDRIRGDMNSAQ